MSIDSSTGPLTALSGAWSITVNGAVTGSGGRVGSGAGGVALGAGSAATGLLAESLRWLHDRHPSSGKSTNSTRVGRIAVRIADAKRRENPRGVGSTRRTSGTDGVF